jgi:glycosyltransferase involved in cell wall biosynthesis
MRRGGEAGRAELTGTVVFGSGLVVAAGLNFAFSSLMGRMLEPPAFGTLGVLIAAILAVIGPANALSGGTEMFAALHDAFPRSRKRLWLPAVALVAWGGCMLSRSQQVRSTGWFLLGAAVLVLLAWNRGALVGLGRFQFVGVSFVVEGTARLVLPVILVVAGFGLEGASAGFVLGMIVALALTETAVPRSGGSTHRPLGREVWEALLGLFALGLTQIVDVFAIRLANPAAAGRYVAAASLARIALFSQMPAAAFALRRTAVADARRALGPTLALSVLPGAVALGLIEAAPGSLLRLSYGDRFPSSVGTLRVLAPAMLLGGFATVAAQLLMGTRSTRWVWSVAPVGVAGTIAIVALAHAPASVAAFSLAIQGCALAVLVPAVIRAVGRGTERPGVLILNWRDRRHPQGGGSEVYVEQLATRLVAGGREVTIFCAAHEGGSPDETVAGVRFVRRGSWRTVYLWAFVYHALGRLGPHQVVIDVKNGVPFFAPLYCRRPVICLVHHVHREQWSMNFPPRRARFGWWVESRLSMRLYRRTPHVAVSESTRRELTALGVPPEAVEVVRNGSDLEPVVVPESARPTIAFLGRLVPHKRVELLLDAAASLRETVPGLRVLIIGHGPWAGRLAERTSALGLEEVVTFTGWVDEETKVRLLGEAWVLAVPSVKEGWGLAVMEAAACRTPTVAFRVGGLVESVRHGVTGLLVKDPALLVKDQAGRAEDGGADLASFGEALRTLLMDHEARHEMGRQAALHAAAYSWRVTAERFEALIEALCAQPIPMLVLEPVSAATDP